MQKHHVRSIHLVPPLQPGDEPRRYRCDSTCAEQARSDSSSLDLRMSLSCLLCIVCLVSHVPFAYLNCVPLNCVPAPGMHLCAKASRHAGTRTRTQTHASSARTHAHTHRRWLHARSQCLGTQSSKHSFPAPGLAHSATPPHASLHLLPGRMAAASHAKSARV